MPLLNDVFVIYKIPACAVAPAAAMEDISCMDILGVHTNLEGAKEFAYNYVQEQLSDDADGVKLNIAGIEDADGDDDPYIVAYYISSHGEKFEDFPSLNGFAIVVRNMAKSL